MSSMARRIVCGLVPLVALAGLAILVLAPEDRGGVEPPAEPAREETFVRGGAPSSPPESSGEPAGGELMRAAARPRGVEELASARPAAPADPTSALLVLLDHALGEGNENEESLAALEAQERAEATLESLRDPSLAPALARIARDHPDAGHRILAADLLADIEPAAARAICEEMLRSESDAGARQFAAIELANLAPGPDGLEALRLALAQDSSRAVREAAALSLARLQGKEALPELRQASDLETSRAVQRTIESAIAEVEK